MNSIYSILLIMLVLAAVGISGCLTSPPRINPQENATITCPVQDFGNDTLYFPCNQGEFASALSQHIGSDNLTVLAISSVLNPYVFNSEAGYIVVVKKE